MALTLQQLRDELRETTGMDVDDLPDAIADRYLNLSWWDLQDKVKLRERETQVDTTLVAGTTSITLTSISSQLDNVTSVALLPDSGSEFKILTKRDYETIVDGYNLNSYAQGVPEEYAIYDAQMFFYPVPNINYSVKVLFRKTLSNIPSGGPNAPQVWHEFVLLGAAMRVFRRNGEFSKASAIRMERDALAVITVEQMVKETEDFHFAGVRPMRQPYYRGT